jgi:hypothetical protein
MRLDLVPSDPPTAGLLEDLADIAVIRRSVEDTRFASRLVGTEPRTAPIAADDR